MCVNKEGSSLQAEFSYNLVKMTIARSKRINLLLSDLIRKLVVNTTIATTKLLFERY
jgi:hypothetical protein